MMYFLPKMLSKAELFIRRGLDFEKEGKNANAYKCFEHGISMLLVCLKHERNPQMKNIMAKRIDEYIKKGEVIKKKMNIHAGDPPTEFQFEPMKDHGDNKLTWDDVIGMDSAKESLKEAVILPRKFPKLFENSIRPWQAILLFGPGGTGKTMLASVLANQTGSNFFSVSSSDLVSKWQGESEKMVKSLFESARNAAPSVIFFDEIDSISTKRSDDDSDSARRIKNELLIQMQGIGDNNKGVFVIGATNAPWVLDAAVRRRFEKRIFVGLPTETSRRKMFKKLLRDIENIDEFLDELVQKTENFSGSDISILCRDIYLQPFRRALACYQWLVHNNTWYPCETYPNCDQCDTHSEVCQHCGAITIDMMDLNMDKVRDVKLPPVTSEDIERSLKNTKASVSEEELQRYKEWCDQYGQN